MGKSSRKLLGINGPNICNNQGFREINSHMNKRQLQGWNVGAVGGLGYDRCRGKGGGGLKKGLHHPLGKLIE